MVDYSGPYKELGIHNYTMNSTTSRLKQTKRNLKKDGLKGMNYRIKLKEYSHKGKPVKAKSREDAGRILGLTQKERLKIRRLR